MNSATHKRFTIRPRASRSRIRRRRACRSRRTNAARQHRLHQLRDKLKTCRHGAEHVSCRTLLAASPVHVHPSPQRKQGNTGLQHSQCRTGLAASQFKKARSACEAILTKHCVYVQFFGDLRSVRFWIRHNSFSISVDGGNLCHRPCKHLGSTA